MDSTSSSTIATKRTVALGGVSETALLPLWGRAHALHMEEPILARSGDKQIMYGLDYDFSHLESRRSSLSGNVLSFTLAARAREFDWQVRSFLLAHTHGTVVNVGAGLDDLFSRTDNGLATWYEIDTAELMELRTELIESTRSPRVHEVAGSILDPAVLARIAPPAEGVLFVFSGVLMYFDPQEIERLMGLLSQYFGSQPGGAQMVFDSLTPLGSRIARSMLDRSGIHEAPIRWSPKNPRVLERFDVRPRLMESYPLCAKGSICPAWGRTLGVLARLSNRIVVYRVNRFLLSPAAPIDFDGVMP